MRILEEGSRRLNDIELHLTDAEAERLIDLVADCRRELAEDWMSESHWHLRDGSTELTVYVYTTNDELESEVAARLTDDG